LGLDLDVAIQLPDKVEVGWLDGQPGLRIFAANVSSAIFFAM
jgi:hypothetical protein